MGMVLFWDDPNVGVDMNGNRDSSKQQEHKRISPFGKVGYTPNLSVRCWKSFLSFYEPSRINVSAYLDLGSA